MIVEAWLTGAKVSRKSDGNSFAADFPRSETPVDFR